MPTSEITSSSTSALPLHSTVDEVLSQLAQGSDLQRQAAERAQAIVSIVAALTDDEEIRKGAALYPLMEAGLFDVEQSTARFGATPARIAGELLRFGSIGALGTRNDGSPLSAHQAET